METINLITVPAKEIRRISRSLLDGLWIKVSIAMIIYYAILKLPVMVYEYFFNDQSSSGQEAEVLDISEFNIDYEPQLITSDIYQFLLSAIFLLSISILFLKVVRKQEVLTKDIFSGFEYFLKAIGLFFMIALFVLLWSLLFIIPGIIAGFRYSQAFYILADNPDMNIMDCINESKRIMNGNKAKLFFVMLSFIGWMILAGLPSGIFQAIVEACNWQNVAGMDLINLILMIPMVFVTVYSTTASTIFYELLYGRRVADLEPVAEEVFIYR